MHVGTDKLLELADALGIGAIAPGDADMALIEPDDVAALDPTLAGDGAGDRNAGLAERFAMHGRFAGPRGLAHVAQDYAARADRRRVADVKAVHGQRVTRR